MNVFNFLKLFSILLFSKIFAAAPENYDDKGLYMRLYTNLLSVGDATLEQIQTIFENGDEKFNNAVENIYLLTETNNLEIIKYVLSKTAKVDSLKRAEMIRYTLNSRLYKCSSVLCQLTPEEPAYAAVTIFLEEIRNDGHPELNNILEDEFLKLIRTGSFSVLEKFFEAGFKLPPSFVINVFMIKKNIVQTIKCLLKNCSNMTNNAMLVFYLMELNEVSASDFKLFLDNGLPLNHKSSDNNWFELALKDGLFEIAELVYKKGLRLSLDKLFSYPSCLKLGQNIGLFVNGLSMSAAYEEAAKIVQIRSIDPESNLNYIPNEILVQEITESLFGLAYEKIVSDLYISP